MLADSSNNITTNTTTTHTNKKKTAVPAKHDATWLDAHKTLQSSSSTIISISLFSIHTTRQLHIMYLLSSKQCNVPIKLRWERCIPDQVVHGLYSQRLGFKFRYTNELERIHFAVYQFNFVCSHLLMIDLFRTFFFSSVLLVFLFCFLFIAISGGLDTKTFNYYLTVGILRSIHCVRALSELAFATWKTYSFAWRKKKKLFT